MFYGWVIVATMWAVNFSSMATGTLNLGLFVLPMGAALGMSRSQFGWAQTTRSLSAGLSSFLIGRLVDRHGSRMLIVVAACVIGACLIGISQATEAWHFMALFGIIGISGLTAPNSLVTSVPVAKWFIRRRGRALALTTAGLGMGGISSDTWAGAVHGWCWPSFSWPYLFPWPAFSCAASPRTWA